MTRSIKQLSKQHKCKNRITQIIIFSSWGALGFKRGINSYNHSFNKDSRLMKIKQHLYLEKGKWGVVSTIAYVHFAVNIRMKPYNKNKSRVSLSTRMGR